MIRPEQYRESARKIDGEKIQFVFHTFLGKKTRGIVREIDELIQQVQGEDGHNFSQKPILNEFSSWGC